MNKRGPRNDPCGTPRFHVPQLEINFVFYNMTVIELCLL